MWFHISPHYSLTWKRHFCFHYKGVKCEHKETWGGLQDKWWRGTSFRSVPCYFSMLHIGILCSSSMKKSDLSPLSIIALESAALKNVELQKMNSYIFIHRLCFLYIKSLCYLYYLRCLLYWLVLWLNTVKSTPKYPYTQVKSKIWINQVLCLGK